MAPARFVSVFAVGLTAALSTLSAAGCVEATEPYAGHVQTYDSLGLFEPTARLDSGTVTTGPKCRFETVRGVDEDAGMGDEKSNTPKPKPVSGTLSISFSTTPPPWGVGAYDIDGTTPNYGVVWIEDPTRRYVKTLELWGLDFIPFTLIEYTRFTRLGCKADTMDVVTNATIPIHRRHSLTWNGSNMDGETVPQGSYVLWLELETQEGPHVEPAQIAIELGDTPWTRQFPQMPLLKDFTVSYSGSRLD